MKIVIFVGMFPPTALAGTELATYNIAKCLSKRGHEIHIITSSDPNLPEEYQEQGFIVHRILKFREMKLRIVGYIYNYFAYRFFYPLIIHKNSLLLVKKIHPNIINIQQIEMGLYGLFPNFFLKIPYVIYARGMNFSDIPGFFESPSRKIALRQADAMILLTNSMRSRFSSYYNGPVHIVPNGIDLNRFNRITKDEARKKYRMKPDEMIIIYAGRLREYKGITYLITAMAEITKRDPLARLVVVGGDQGERINIEKMIDDLSLRGKIDLTGEKSPEEVLEYMAGADIFVLPSLREGFPNVTLEAMGSGLPIVSTNVDGLPEIVAEGINGFLVPPKNPQALAEKVLVLLKDRELRETISRNNLERVKQYEIDAIAGQLENIYSMYQSPGKLNQSSK